MPRRFSTTSGSRRSGARASTGRTRSALRKLGTERLIDLLLELEALEEAVEAEEAEEEARGELRARFDSGRYARVADEEVLNAERVGARRRRRVTRGEEALIAALHAVEAGDFRIRLTTEDGVSQGIAAAFNALVERNAGFAAEVHRVGVLIGRHGELDERLSPDGLTGEWMVLAQTLNELVANLTWQTSEVARVASAVAEGDFSQKLPPQRHGVPLEGDSLSIVSTINALVDQLRTVTSEVTRVAREVGSEGKLGAKAEIEGLSGSWRDLADIVNMLAGNLTSQVRNIALVTTAVANGDLSQKIDVQAQGEFQELKDTINAMVDRLRTLAAEVTRVAREVGTDGKLGGQAQVPGVAGTWKDLTENVNQLAGNLTSQVRNIALVTTAVANGDLSQKITVDAQGEILALKETINAMVDQLRTFAAEVTRVAREVGTEGKLGGQAEVPDVGGTWKDLTDSVNMLAGNLTSQVRNIALVTTAVAKGDLSQKITVDARGEILELKNTINAMVDQLRTFAAEVTRVAREVGSEGKLGGQAEVPGVGGTWRDLTDNVNMLAGNLTSQVRGIVKVVTAVANGDLTQKLKVEAKGEIAALADTINAMTDTLRVFAEQVITVAREVGIEGKLGGQARVPGAAGTWRDLTDNVNSMAGSLTNQVRAISEVASAVTKGDLSRTITVEAQGEVLALSDTINQMIRNLRETTQKNQEQDWLKTNVARFSGMMQGQRSLASLAQLIMSELTPLVSAQQGAFFVMQRDEGRGQLRLLSSYAYQRRKTANTYELGEGLVGQCALEKKTIIVTDVPADYTEIVSGLGSAPPRNIILLPVLFEGRIKGVIELASFQEFSPIHLTLLEQIVMSIGVVFNMIAASTRTEELLKELKGSNVELEKRTTELEEKASLLEQKNREIAEASASLEEKADQLAQVSRYKSEFLANMSHELRTPLNSLLILAKLLADNERGNLDPKQVEYARTIYASGTDLMALINQILDLSKIEAGKMVVETQRLPLDELRQYVDWSFRELSRQKGLAFRIEIASDAPEAISTDPHRVQQILKNLLSNAFKFTDEGSVALKICCARKEKRFRNPALNRAPAVLAFEVSDTGIGIPAAKQHLIFEAFQQADASTSRTHGGTGLGLTISRELARLLGGEIELESEEGRGSTFTLYLPITEEDLKSARDGEEIGRSAAEETPEPAPLADEERAPGEYPELSGRRVVLVDDDARNLFAVTSMLERYGIEVVAASSGKEGLEALETHEGIDLVLMDIMMPGMDGYETTRRIRDSEHLRDVPVVALTAKAMPGDREKCIEAGCDDFVPKPVEPSRLLETMRRVLKKRTARGGPATD